MEHVDVKVNSHMGSSTAELTVGNGAQLAKPNTLVVVREAAKPIPNQKNTKYKYTAPTLIREPAVRGELEHHSEGP